MVNCYKYLHGVYQVAGNLLGRDQDSRTRSTDSLWQKVLDSEGCQLLELAT